MLAASAGVPVTVALVLTGLLDPREAATIVIAVELLLVMAVSVTAITGLRALRRQRGQGAAPWPALVATVHDVLPGPLAALMLHEATILRSLCSAVRRSDDAVGPQDVAFGYTAGQGLTTGALATVAAVELAVAHLLVPWPWARTRLLVAGVWSLILVLAAWAGRRRHPHVVSAYHLLLRAGPRTIVEIPWSALSAVRRVTLQAPTSVTANGQRLHLPVDGTTRLLAELIEPVTARLPFGRTAQIDSVAFSGDDPQLYTLLCSTPGKRCRLQPADPHHAPATTDRPDAGGTTVRGRPSRPTTRSRTDCSHPPGCKQRPDMSALVSVSVHRTPLEDPRPGPTANQGPGAPVPHRRGHALPAHRL